MFTAKKNSTAKLGLALLAIAVVGLLATGCSQNSPLAPSDNGLDALLKSKAAGNHADGSIFVTPQKGGVLKLEVVGARTELHIPSGAVAEPVEITGSVESFMTENGMTFIYDFGPDGLVFLEPAKLKIKTDDKRDKVLTLWWFNPATDQWEFQACASPDANGTSQFRINHFSKYAIS